MIFKQETIKSWFTGVGKSINNEVVQPFQNANSIINKYNLAIQHNSLTQQGWQRLLAQSDDSLKAYLTSIKGTTASMSGYNVSLQGNITGFTKITKAMQQYNALGATSQKEQQAFATAVSATNTKLGSYLTGLNGAKASLSGYGLSLIASTAKTVGLTVATTALNATLTMGISLIVSGLISAFVSWIHKSEEIAEKAQEAADKINSINDSLKSNTETVENAKKRYAELAQEVENLGKITQSQGTLSNEEYAEFLDLSNQLAEIFPSLTKNYDANGNAILGLSGNVNTIVSSLDSLIQKEKELANQKIMEEFPDVFKGWNQDLSDAEQKAKSAKTEFDKINNAYQQLSNGTTSQAFDLQRNGWFTNENGEKITISMNEYISNLEALGLEYEETQIKVKNQFGGDTLSGYLIKATGDIDTAFTSKLEKAREDLQYAQQQLEGQTSSINQYLNTWLQDESFYIQIEDSGLQTAIQDMLFNFDWDNIPEDKRGDWNYVSEYLRRNILFEINKVQDDPVISKAISEVFTNAELTPDEKASYLQQITDFFGEDSAVTISLKPQIEETETLQKQYDKAIEDTKKKFDGYDPTAFFKEHSINTQEEIDRWQEIAEAVDTATELKEQYLTIGEETKPFSQRFQDLWDSESFKDAREELQKLAKEAGITEDDLYSLARENEELSLLLDESGISAQFAATCFNQVCNGADGFSAITEDALALDQVLHGMDESLQSAAASKSAYDKAMGQDDYDSEFKNYQDAYKSAMEMFENGDYGKHFRSAMEYLLGDKSYTMSIEEMKNAMDGLKNVFGEDATNGLEFLDKLYEKKDVLDGLDSSLEKLSDGSYKFDLKPDEFEAIGEAIGMTTDEVAACTNALGMFGDFRSYDMEELEETLNGISIAAKDGEKSILSLQGVESIFSDRGYNGYEIYHILEDIKGMGSLELLDFNASDSEGLQTVIDKLSELDMLKINGDSIDVSGLADKLKNTFGMTFEDIQTFLASLGEGFDFTDSMGTDVVDAYSSIQEKIKSIQAEIASGSYSTDEIVQMQTQLEELKRRADALREPVDIKLTSNIDQTKEKLEEVTRKYNELKTSIASKQEQGITVTYGDTNALNELANQKAALEEQLNHYNELKVTVEMEREQADADIKDLTSDKETKLTVNIANKGEVDAQFNQWTQPKSTTLKVNVTANDPNGLLKGGTPTSGQAGNSGNSSSSSPASGTVKALGNAQIGHSFADGTIGGLRQKRH